MYRTKSSTNALTVIGAVVVVIALIAGLVALEAWLVQVLWNWLAVELFNAKEISWTLGLGIVLALSFIGGFFKRASS